MSQQPLKPIPSSMDDPRRGINANTATSPTPSRRPHSIDTLIPIAPPLTLVSGRKGEEVGGDLLRSASPGPVQMDGRSDAVSGALVGGVGDGFAGGGMVGIMGGVDAGFGFGIGGGGRSGVENGREGEREGGSVRRGSDGERRGVEGSGGGGGGVVQRDETRGGGGERQFERLEERGKVEDRRGGAQEQRDGMIGGVGEQQREREEPRDGRKEERRDDQQQEREEPRDGRKEGRRGSGGERRGEDHGRDDPREGDRREGDKAREELKGNQNEKRESDHEREGQRDGRSEELRGSGGEGREGFQGSDDQRRDGRRGGGQGKEEKSGYGDGRRDGDREREEKRYDDDDHGRDERGGKDRTGSGETEKRGRQDFSMPRQDEHDSHHQQKKDFERSPPHNNPPEPQSSHHNHHKPPSENLSDHDSHGVPDHDTRAFHSNHDKNIKDVEFDEEDDRVSRTRKQGPQGSHQIGGKERKEERTGKGGTGENQGKDAREHGGMKGGRGDGRVKGDKEPSQGGRDHDRGKGDQRRHEKGNGYREPNGSTGYHQELERSEGYKHQGSRHRDSDHNQIRSEKRGDRKPDQRDEPHSHRKEGVRERHRAPEVEFSQSPSSPRRYENDQKQEERRDEERREGRRKNHESSDIDSSLDKRRESGRTRRDDAVGRDYQKRRHSEERRGRDGRGEERGRRRHSAERWDSLRLGNDRNRQETWATPPNDVRRIPESAIQFAGWNDSRQPPLSPSTRENPFIESWDAEPETAAPLTRSMQFPAMIPDDLDWSGNRIPSEARDLNDAYDVGVLDGYFEDNDGYAGDRAIGKVPHPPPFVQPPMRFSDNSRPGSPARFPDHPRPTSPKRPGMTRPHTTTIMQPPAPPPPPPLMPMPVIGMPASISPSPVGVRPSSGLAPSPLGLPNPGFVQSPVGVRPNPGFAQSQFGVRPSPGFVSTPLGGIRPAPGFSQSPLGGTGGATSPVHPFGEGIRPPPGIGGMASIRPSPMIGGFAGVNRPPPGFIPSPALEEMGDYYEEMDNTKRKQNPIPPPVQVINSPVPNVNESWDAQPFIPFPISVDEPWGPPSPVTNKFPVTFQSEGWDAEPTGTKSSLKKPQPDRDDWSLPPESTKGSESKKSSRRPSSEIPPPPDRKRPDPPKPPKNEVEDGILFVKRKGEVVIKRLSEKRSVKLFFDEDIEAFDRIMAWERATPDGNPQKAMEQFCSKFRAADALIPIIYGSETWDYVLRFKQGKRENLNADIRESFEKRLLENGAILEIEESFEGNQIVFVKMILPFYVLCSLARQCKLKLKLGQPFHPLREDALPKKRKGLAGALQYHLDLNEQRAVFDETRIAKFQFREMNADGEYRINQIADHPGYTIKAKFFEGRHRIYLAYKLLTTTILKVRRKSRCRNEGIRFLFKIGAYIDMFPTHEDNYYYNEVTWKRLSESAAGARVNTLRSRLRDIYFKRSWFSTQPYELMKDYFGEKVALYFVYLGFYNTWLCISSTMGLVVFFYGMIKILSSQNLKPAAWNTLFDNELTLPYALGMSIWSVLYLEFWKRRSSYYSYLWGVQNYEKDEVRRHEFKPKGSVCSPITGKLELVFPRYLRTMRQIISQSALCLAILTVIATIFGQIVLFWFVKSRTPHQWAAAPASAFTGLACIWIGRQIFRPLCYLLTEWENYKTETEFEDALLLKIWSFEFFNIYLHVVYSAFLRPFVTISQLTGINDFIDQICEQNTCSAELTLELLIIFLGDQLFSRFYETVLPNLSYKFRSRKKRKGVDPTAEVFYPQHYRDEKKEDGRGIADDYFQKTVQYGYVTLFVSAFPIAPVFALLNNFFEVRTDSFKLLEVLRRPPPLITQDIGVWEHILRKCSLISITTNSLLIIFVSNYFKTEILSRYSESSWAGIRIGTFIVWHILVYSIWVLLMWLVPNEPDIVRLAQQREDYLEKISVDPNYEVEDERLDSQTNALTSSEVDLRGNGFKLKNMFSSNR
ncbi:Anoctamin-3 [Dinochytrium kinnereticum]|nr:Anoctamin-3 [Dinochytrium kinnereticum]